MELYNVNDKVVENVSTIQTEVSISYPDKLSKEELKEKGYIPVEQGEIPQVALGDFETISRRVDIDEDSYKISYAVVDMSDTEILLLVKKRIQDLLDEKAIAKGYDNILSACSYAGFDNPFRAEGEKFGKWRSEVWSKGYAILKDITEGHRKLPKSFKEILDELPILEEI